MADQNVDQPIKGSVRAKRRGAAALKALIDALGAEEQRHFEQSSWEGDEYDDGFDPADWVSLARMVERGLQRDYVNASAAHREGFVRALATLFAGLPNSVPTWEHWDPIGMTEPAFSSHIAAKRLTREAAGPVAANRA